MSRIRLSLLSLLAVFAVSAVASASASAEPCTKGTEEWSLCVEKVEAAENTEQAFVSEEESGTEGVAVLKTEGFTIECARTKDKGTFVTGADSTNVSVSDLEIKYTKCTESINPTKCEVVEPIVVGATDGAEGTVVGVAGAPELTIEPSEGTEFTTITLKSKPGQTCLAAGKYVVKGKQTCGLKGPGEDEGAEEEAFIHDIVCTTAGSQLTVGGKAATYSGSADVIIGLKEFSIFRS